MNDDQILRRMATLPLAMPDKARAARVRQRCHSALQHAAGHRAAARDAPRHSWTAPAMTVLALVYLAQVVRLTLLVYVAR